MLKKKISKILIGTNNKGKLKEIRGLLPKSIKIFSTSDFIILPLGPEPVSEFGSILLICASLFARGVIKIRSIIFCFAFRV